MYSRCICIETFFFDWICPWRKPNGMEVTERTFCSLSPPIRRWSGTVSSSRLSVLLTTSSGVVRHFFTITARRRTQGSFCHRLSHLSSIARAERHGSRVLDYRQRQHDHECRRRRGLRNNSILLSHRILIDCMRTFARDTRFVRGPSTTKWSKTFNTKNPAKFNYLALLSSATTQNVHISPLADETLNTKIKKECVPHSRIIFRFFFFRISCVHSAPHTTAKESTNEGKHAVGYLSTLNESQPAKPSRTYMHVLGIVASKWMYCRFFPSSSLAPHARREFKRNGENKVEAKKLST